MNVILGWVQKKQAEKIAKDQLSKIVTALVNSAQATTSHSGVFDDINKTYYSWEDIEKAKKEVL